MQSAKDVLDGFKTASGTNIDDLSFFIKGFFASLLFLLGAYILFSIYKDITDEKMDITGLISSLMRLLLLLSVMFFVFF